MGRYVIRRLLQMIPVFFGTTLLIFLMVNVMGDPIAYFAATASATPRPPPSCAPSSASTSRSGSNT